jgi:hypothetical protein
MTTSESTKVVSALPGDLIHTIRRYLGNRRLLLAVAILGLVAGAALNWGWLVALGIAPVILSLLPCAVMCGLGVCCLKMMGGSGEKQPGQSGHPAATSESPVALGIATMNRPSLLGSSCCHGSVGETQPSPVKTAQSLDEGGAPMRNSTGTR